MLTIILLKAYFVPVEQTTIIALMLLPGKTVWMEVYTDLPGVQLYAGNYLDSSHIGKGDFPYDKRYGVCFESQYFPNAVNVPTFEQPIAKAGEKAHSTTIYKFL